jgi:hypothetical protein
VNKLISKCKKKNMEVQSIGYLLTLAQIHQKSGNPVAALTSVLSCLTQSENFNLDNLFVMSTVRLAEIHLQMGNSQKALSSLHSVLPQVMQHCPLHVKCVAAPTAPPPLPFAKLPLRNVALLQSRYLLAHGQVPPVHVKTRTRPWYCNRPSVHVNLVIRPMHSHALVCVAASLQ